MKSADKNRDPERARKRASSDARCAWRKMGPQERIEFLEWLEAEHGVADGAHLPDGWSIVDPGRHWTTGGGA